MLKVWVLWFHKKGLLFYKNLFDIGKSYIFFIEYRKLRTIEFLTPSGASVGVIHPLWPIPQADSTGGNHGKKQDKYSLHLKTNVKLLP